MNTRLDKDSCINYMQAKVNEILGPLVVDLMKEQPDDIMSYIITWCQQKRNEYISRKSSNTKTLKNNITDSEAENKIAKNMELVDNSIIKYKKESTAQTDHKKEDLEFENRIQEKIKNRKKKNAVSAEVYGKYNKMIDFKPPVIKKDKNTTLKIKEILGKSFMFDSLDENALNVIISAMNVRNFKAGETVIKQGDNGEELYIVSEGILKCYKSFEGEKEVFLRNYESGQVFGELSLFYNTPRAASIYADTESICFSLDRATFSMIVKRSAIEKKTRIDETLKNMDILKGLSDNDISKVNDCLQMEKYQKDDYIVKEGEDGDKLYFIQEGSAVALKSDIANGEKIVYEFNKNDYFGEIAIIENCKRKASIKVVSNNLTALSITRAGFNRVLGDLTKTFKKNINRYNRYKSK